MSLSLGPEVKEIREDGKSSPTAELLVRPGARLGGAKKYQGPCPEKLTLAHAAVYDAILAGKLPPLSDCPCGRIAVAYHHHSYLPEHLLSVVPVCGVCHWKIHTGQVPEPLTGEIRTGERRKEDDDAMTPSWVISNLRRRNLRGPPAPKFPERWQWGLWFLGQVPEGAGLRRFQEWTGPVPRTWGEAFESAPPEAFDGQFLARQDPAPAPKPRKPAAPKAAVVRPRASGLTFSLALVSP